MKNESEQIKKVAEKFVNLTPAQKEFVVGYLTGKRDQKQLNK